MRSTRIALMLTLALAGLDVTRIAHAQHSDHQDRGKASRKAEHGPGAAARAAEPPVLEPRRRDGHMTPEERHLLRQHIEDAVRNLYGR